MKKTATVLALVLLTVFTAMPLYAKDKSKSKAKDAAAEQSAEAVVTEETAATETAAENAEAQSQSEDAAQATEKTPKSKATISFSGVRGGAFVCGEMALGGLNNYVWCNAGGGFVMEIGMPVTLPEDYKGWAGAFTNVGFSMEGQAAVNPPKTELLSSMWNMRYTFRVFMRLPVLKANLILQPEVGYGVVLNYPTANPTYPNELSKCYVDQVLIADASIRISNPELLKGKVEFAITPEVLFCPEKGGFVCYYGAKFGALYCF